jgi:hypothetical protein
MVAISKQRADCAPSLIVADKRRGLTVPTWAELETNFRELVPALRFYRLDFQWGAAGTNYRIAGGGLSPQTRRFEVLAALAGEKLAELPRGHVAEIALQRRDPAEKWYEALKASSGMFELGFYGIQQDADGTNRGTIYTGHIAQFPDASALLALQYSAVPQPQIVFPQTRWSRLNRWLKLQRDQHGVFWAVVFAIVTILLAAIALAV